MNQEDKDLLLKDLCGRLPYKIRCSYYDICLSAHCSGEIYGIENKEYAIVDGKCIAIEFIRPYLFPLSSMIEEQKEELYNIQGVLTVDFAFEEYKMVYLFQSQNVIDWLNKNNFDYRGLIPKGLANDATGLNIY